MIEPNFIELLQRHRHHVHMIALSNEKYQRNTGPAYPGVLGSHEMSERLDICNGLDLGLLGQLKSEALLQSCAEIGWHGFGLRYRNDDGRGGQWVPAVGEDDSFTEPLLRRSDHYLDRALSDTGVGSFPMTDMALIAASFGLPLALWEADNRKAFEEFARLEHERRRGVGQVKPLLAFDPLDYLLSLARDTMSLQIYHDIQAAAGAGVLAARQELLDEGVYVDGLRAARARVPVLTIPAGERLWFQCPLPGGFEQRCEALLFEISRSDDTEQDSEGRAAALLSSSFSHAGDASCSTIFESPVVPGAGVELSPSEESEIILLLARKGSLQSLRFFQRTSKVDASLELSRADLDDLRRCLLRIDPADRQVLRRKIRIAG